MMLVINEKEPMKIILNVSYFYNYIENNFILFKLIDF